MPSSRRQRLSVLSVIAALALAPPATRLSAKATAFHLANADIPKAVLVAEKPGRLFVELTYSKTKQDELRALTASDLPKTIDITVGQIPLGEREFKSPAKGYTIKFDFESLPDALALLGSLGWSQPADDNTVTTTSEASLIELTDADVGRVILYLFRPGRSNVEATCMPAKRDELLYLLRQQPARPVLVSVGGRIAAELKPDAKVSPAGGIRFDISSPALALDVTRALATRP